jgi:ATP-binding cassette subfamily B protein
MDCGPTCLRMVAKHYGRHYNADTLREQSGYGKSGVSLLGISETAEKIGFRTRGVQISLEKLLTVPLPAILHWDQSHFVVLISLNKTKAVIADPSIGIICYKTEEFRRHWLSNHSEGTGLAGTALLLEPVPAFYKNHGEKEHKLNWGLALSYLFQSRHRVVQILLSLVMTSVLQLLLPFLTQSMVDTGINTRDMKFITIVLFAQLTLTFSSTVIQFIRSRLQLRVSNSISISLLSDFWIKLTRLPISYFDARQTGDTLQRIDDNRKIQSFFTGETLSTIFAVLNFFVYSFVLILFSMKLFLVFIIGNLFYFVWVSLFLHIRRKLNYEVFNLSSRENNATLQLVQGMQEIRLNNAERLKRWEWENIQINLFKVNLRNLNYSQWQSAGALFINQGKDILISFLVAQMVVKGQLTFGTMLAVQYILGQLSGPVSQFVGLAQSVQDVKISMERLNEVHEMPDEEPAENTLLTSLPEQKELSFRNVSFAFPDAGNELVISGINLVIPEGRVTAIVGMSGSGKTTMLKLLLKIFSQFDGEIRIGKTNFKHISPSFWRSQCGAVLQDGYIFNDSIARNIAVGDEYVDHEKLLTSCRIANITSFVESLPNGFNTVLGSEGTGLSQGQRQRILIARAVYKDPCYLFFDEATNALDANNEKEIVGHLDSFFRGRTVVVVAHRLSTVKDADKIVVLDNGKIVEEGSHEYLIALKGHYYELVKNQLELGQ